MKVPQRECAIQQVSAADSFGYLLSPKPILPRKPQYDGKRDERNQRYENEHIEGRQMLQTQPSRQIVVGSLPVVLLLWIEVLFPHRGPSMRTGRGQLTAAHERPLTGNQFNAFTDRLWPPAAGGPGNCLYFRPRPVPVCHDRQQTGKTIVNQDDPCAASCLLWSQP